MNNKTNQEQTNIDESLYSRQLYAIGKDAMGKITQTNVLISGLTGPGIELAKCIILAGVKRVTIHTPMDCLTYRDLGSNYYADIADIGKEFLEKTVKELASLNSNVIVDTTKYISSSFIDNYMIAVFCDYSVHDLIFWNRYCRDHGIKFIMLQTYGLAGNLFCDFGDEYQVNDIDGEPVRNGRISFIKSNIFHCTEPHRLYTGDVIELHGNICQLEKNVMKYIVKAITCTEFSIYELKETEKLEKIMMHVNKFPCFKIIDQVTQNVTFTQIKLPVKYNFKSLKESLDDPEFQMFDIIDWNMPMILNTFMKTLSIWQIYNKTYVQRQEYPLEESDYTTMLNFFKYELMVSHKDINMNQVQDIFDKLFYTCAGSTPGVDAIIGSMGAQEVLKAASNKFTPNKQFLHFEALNVLPTNYLEKRKEKNDNYLPTTTRYSGQDMIFGHDYVKMMRNKKIFVVGAGAIGCEHVKNFSMMGIGSIVITDMDMIENSNLNRQFLFRRADIGRSKSETVAEKAKQMNEDIEIIAHNNKVCKETLNVYNSQFFKNIDVVATALDNIEARLFVDSLCVKYNKALLESGTLGTKGNVQVIVPDLTESYASLKDPGEENIPVCTLKLFPYKYEHVVQYSRDLFEGYFNRIPSNYIKLKKMDQKSVLLATMNPGDLETIYQDVLTLTKNCKNFKNCINMGFKEWHKLYRDSIFQLIRKYPENHKDDDGNLFWSQNKIYPQVREFDVSNSVDLDFVISFSQIWADMLGIDKNKRYHPSKRNKYEEFIKTLKIPDETMCSDINHTESKNNSKNNIQDPANIIKLLNQIIRDKNIDNLLINLSVIEFEKDNDSNYHIDFITAGSNKRAFNYKIDAMDRLMTKGLAGKIIPALATTTSLVSGLISLEMYKIFYGQMYPEYNTLERYRYGAFNLGVQTFGFGESNAAKKVLINGKYYDIWTKEQLNPEHTIDNLIDQYLGVKYIKNVNGKNVESALELDFIAGDQGIIYSSTMDIIGNSDENNIRHKTLRNIIKETVKEENLGGDYFFTLSLEELDDDNDVDFNKINTDTMITCRVTL